MELRWNEQEEISWKRTSSPLLSKEENDDEPMVDDEDVFESAEDHFGSCSSERIEVGKLLGLIFVSLVEGRWFRSFFVLSEVGGLSPLVSLFYSL